MVEKKISLPRLLPNLEYTISDFRADFPNFEKNLAEVTLSEFLRVKGDKLKNLLKSCKLSRKIGVCIFLSELGFSYPKERLEFLQSIAPVEALDAGNKIFIRLKNDLKFRKDNYLLFYYFCKRKYKPRKKRVKFTQFHRGYRDKGTLPDLNSKIREKIQESSYLNTIALERKIDVEIIKFLKSNLPEDLFEGDFLDIHEALLFLEEEEAILERLKKILWSL